MDTATDTDLDIHCTYPRMSRPTITLHVTCNNLNPVRSQPFRLSYLYGLPALSLPFEIS